MKRGKLYGLGVGPGDPELMTIKAVRCIEECEVIAAPGVRMEESVAYQIARGACPGLDEKELVPVAMPMTKDPEILRKSHEAAADQIEKYLRQGKNVAFLTLGDTTIYSTYLYLHRRILEKGYEASLVSGVTSFCAAAARVCTGLAEGSEMLHIIPATFQTEKLDEILCQPGTKVLMKSGKHMGRVREALMTCGQQVIMVENCGMEQEKVYWSAEEIPQNAGYYSLIIVKPYSQQAGKENMI